ncbi:MAG: type I glyceraldehyde-3-phosphate dehydrogenase [Chitinophagales bacterium]|nr:type I glyceraldehyde-3-phosphate dehydrogenase [Chitinophagales bacterium]
MKTKIAINGLGRIGRLLFRTLWNHPQIEIVACNDLAPNDALAHLLKYDTAQGTWHLPISADEEHIIVDNKKIKCTAIKDATELPWKEDQIDIVIDCSGFYRTYDKAQLHIQAGAKKVIISAPADDKTKTIVMGINDNDITSNDIILSNASCTTNCMAPMVKVIMDNFTLENAIMNTIHAYTGDQKLQDSIHKDWRRARAAAENIVPTTSNAAQALSRVMPETKDKISGGAVRVPVIVGSLTELYCKFTEEVSVEAINNAFKLAAQNELKNILAYTEDPIVSSDIIHDPHSCIFDAGLTLKVGQLIKIVGWYDNEFGYTNRLAELVEKVAQL